MDTFWLITFFLLGFYVTMRVLSTVQDRQFQREEADRERMRRSRIDELYGHRRAEESYDDGT